MGNSFVDFDVYLEAVYHISLVKWWPCFVSKHSNMLHWNLYDMILCESMVSSKRQTIAAWQQVKIQKIKITLSACVSQRVFSNHRSLVASQVVVLLWLQQSGCNKMYTRDTKFKKYKKRTEYNFCESTGFLKPKQLGSYLSGGGAALRSTLALQ